MPQYPEIILRYEGDPNQLITLIGRTQSEMRKAGVAIDERNRFGAEALTAFEPDEILDVCRRWVTVE